MAKYVIDGATLSSIADSIRVKKGTTANIAPENMPTEIASIETGGGGENLDDVIAEQAELIEQLSATLDEKAQGGAPTPTQEKTVDIKENGTVEVTPDEGYALSKVTANVNVPIPDGYIKPIGTLSIEENGTHDVTDKASVEVNVPIPDGYVKPSGELEITANGQYNVTEKASVLVDIPERLPILQEKTVTENGEVTADSGYDGLSKVTVNVSTGGGGGTDTRFKDYFEGTLTEIVDSTITKLKANAFRSAGGVTLIDLPNCTSVGGSVFRECTMTTLNMPTLTGATGTYFCYNCPNLENVNAPKLTTMSNSSFRSCIKLKKIEFDNPTTIASSAFQDASALDTLIIRKTESRCTLSAANAFNGTPIASGTGYIYVYKSMVDSYKSASNWSTYASQIRAIEDYPEITGGA